MNDVRATILALAAAVALPGALAAQGVEEHPVSFDFGAGAAVPAGDYADLARPGASFELGTRYWFTDHVALRAEGDAGFFTGQEITDARSFPDQRLYQYDAGLALSILDRSDEERPWSLTADAGLGATTLDTDAIGFAMPDVTETWVSASGGVEAGYEVTRNVDVAVSADARVAFADDEELQPLLALAPSMSEIGTIWSFPLTAELQFRLP